MSHRSSVLNASITLYFSRFWLIRLFLRIPAVSMRTYRRPSRSKGVSMASRVVPGRGLTMVRS